MRTPLLIAGTALLLLNSITLPAQTNLNWASSFLPTWANGNTSGIALNIGGSGINGTASASIVGGGSFRQALGSSGAQTPTVSGATFTVPGTTNRLQVTPNFSNNTGHTDIILTFTSMATNITFRIVDIDKSDATSTTYFDQVTVTGSNGVTTYNATLSKYDAVTDPNFLVVSGNVARVNTTSGQAGNSNSDAVDQRGTVNVNFGTASINSITIRYENAPGANTNPASQAIAVGAISFSNSTLPVSLSAFSGHRQGQDVVLDWATEQEINAATFEVERSTGSSWEKIAALTAAGTTSSRTNYSYADVNPQGSVLLYRLKQIDLDGNFKYSSIVRINSNNKVLLSSYPNPFSGQINVSIGSASRQLAAVTITDASGKTIRSETKNLYSGNNNFTITGLDRLASGIYYLQVTGEERKILGSSKIIKN